MCNKLHPKYKEIAPEGKAYKLVQWHQTGWMMLTRPFTYDVDTDGWVRWRPLAEERKPYTLGFCFIPTLREAIKAHKAWEKGTLNSDTKIVEVDYKQGLGRFDEVLFISGKSVDVILAREFEIIRKVT